MTMTRDKISGAMAITIGGLLLPFALGISTNNPFMKTTDIGPKFFPAMACVLLLIGGGGLIAFSPKEQDKYFSGRQWMDLILVYCLTLAYIFVMSKTGFLSATVVYLFILCSLFLREKHLAWWKRALYAIIIGGGIYCLFTYALEMRLITGFFI